MAERRNFSGAAGNTRRLRVLYDRSNARRLAGGSGFGGANVASNQPANPPLNSVPVATVQVAAQVNTAQDDADGELTMGGTANVPVAAGNGWCSSCRRC